jgi:Phytanoyl-CoA dioxygenase (PhyH)
VALGGRRRGSGGPGGRHAGSAVAEAGWTAPDGPSQSLTDTERYVLDLNGYVVLKGVLDADQVAYLNKIIDDRALPPPAASIPSQRFTGMLMWDQAFRDLLTHPRVLPVMAEMVGDRLRLDHCYGIVMAPGTDGLGLHGGATPFDPAQYALFRDGRMHHGLSVAMYALVDAGPDEGGFCCVPGSHKASFRLPGGIAHAPAHLSVVRQVPHSAGDVIVFTEALTHGTSTWLAPYERRHILYKYSPGNSTWGVPEEPSPELAVLLTEQQRRLLALPSVGSRQPVVL